MAPSKAGLDLNEMIQKDRERRKNENLAKEIFGKNRRQSAPGAASVSNRRAALGSLESRIGGGIAKRTVSSAAGRGKPSAGNVDAEWTHDLHGLNNPAASKVGRLPPRGPKAQRGRGDRIYNALNGSASSPALNNQFNIVGSAKASAGISIRGLAGPYLVMVKNLALGTTPADIESAMRPVGGVVLGCRVVAERPKVIAELIFETKKGAENVVETFNNQNADGNILQVYHKTGPIPPALLATLNKKKSSPPPRSITPLGPRADIRIDRSDDVRSGNGSRSDRSPQRRRDYDRDDVMDGSYGFQDDRMDTDDRQDSGRGGLYSDNLITNRGQGRGNSRDRGRLERGGGGGGRGYR